MYCRQHQNNTPLKSKLLKIAASSDGGGEQLHNDSLSRPAKLVLASSGGKPKLYNSASTAPEIIEKTAMFSNHIDQKYGPKVKLQCIIMACLREKNAQSM